jgi:hypothetical protein
MATDFTSSASPSARAAYLHNRASLSPWRVSGNAGTDHAGAVVIPALAESEHLFATLDSLAQNPPELLRDFLVVVVVNHRASTEPADRADNLRTLEGLSDYADSSPLNLAWIDAASPGLELPEGGGVGLARKIGLDHALGRLDFDRAPPLLLSLDADTLVQPDYLPAVREHFRQAAAGGAFIPFRHRLEGEAAEQQAIITYELFLRSYVLGLSLAGSPYAFHTIGSAMAWRAQAYIAAGGMNRRQAGEDFHFLQQLARHGGVQPLTGTIVHPSARSSHRVPFGTGRAVSRLLDGDPQAVRFYDPGCFRVLAAWLRLMADHGNAPVEAILQQAGSIAETLPDFLGTCHFPEIWPKMQAQHRSAERLHRAFHGWFHGLRTLRMIHHLSAAALPRCGPEGVPPLLRWGGWPAPTGQLQQLEMLRSLQGAVPQQQVLAAAGIMG